MFFDVCVKYTAQKLYVVGLFDRFEKKDEIVKVSTTLSKRRKRVLEIDDRYINDFH